MGPRGKDGCDVPRVIQPRFTRFHFIRLMKCHACENVPNVLPKLVNDPCQIHDPDRSWQFKASLMNDHPCVQYTSFVYGGGYRSSFILHTKICMYFDSC